MSTDRSHPFSMYAPAKLVGGQTLLMLGEAPGEEEDRAGVPFVGSSGRLLHDPRWDAGLLPSSGFSRDRFHWLNVFSERPPNNDLKLWTLNKSELKKLKLSSTLPPLGKRYLHPAHEMHVTRLREELLALKPTLIIALGATALWALTGESRITTFRGTFFRETLTGLNLNCIATFHPTAVLRQWDYYPICWADLVKARNWLEGNLPAPLHRKLWINPTFEEIEHVYNKFKAEGRPLGTDIETAPAAAQITTVAFSTPEEGICIPIWNRYSLPAQCHYWSTVEEEVKAWQWIARFAALPNHKILQNGLYDSQYFLDAPIEIRLNAYTDDTAILQHALQPELKKDLGTLSSLYLNEPSWKWMRTSDKDDNKADE